MAEGIDSRAGDIVEIHLAAWREEKAYPGSIPATLVFWLCHASCKPNTRSSPSTTAAASPSVSILHVPSG